MLNLTICSELLRLKVSRIVHPSRLHLSSLWVALSLDLDRASLLVPMHGKAVDVLLGPHCKQSIDIHLLIH